MKDATRGPIFACLYPGLCEVARRYGYALALHGTLVGDMDLIAVPWTGEAVDAVTLKDALMRHIGACGYDALLERDSPWLTADQRRQVCERQGIGLEGDHSCKPHGRIAWNLHLWAGTKVDLSVLPRLPGTGAPPAALDVGALLERRHVAVLEWCEPWPACGPEGNDLDAHVTLRATVHDCINLQRRVARSSGRPTVGDDENHLLDFMAVHTARVVGARASSADT